VRSQVQLGNEGFTQTAVAWVPARVARLRRPEVDGYRLRLHSAAAAAPSMGTSTATRAYVRKALPEAQGISRDARGSATPTN
jgi:hypothetical protein